jgi:hypothetical protein
LHRERNEATVIVNDDQLSKAIGKEGKNVRLAAKLTEWKIDLVSSREYSIRQRVTEEMTMKLAEMSDITEDLLARLEEVGIMTISQLAEESLERLANIEGIDEDLADNLLATAQATQEELQRMIDKTVAEELEKENAEDRPLFDEDALSDEDHEETAGATEGDEAEETPGKDIFEDFPEGDDHQEEGAKASGEDDEPKVDPFANTELDD